MYLSFISLIWIALEVVTWNFFMWIPITFPWNYNLWTLDLQEMGVHRCFVLWKEIWIFLLIHRCTKFVISLLHLLWSQIVWALYWRGESIPCKLKEKEVINRVVKGPFILGQSWIWCPFLCWSWLGSGHQDVFWIDNYCYSLAVEQSFLYSWEVYWKFPICTVFWRFCEVPCQWVEQISKKVSYKVSQMVWD